MLFIFEKPVIGHLLKNNYFNIECPKNRFFKGLIFEGCEKMRKF